MSAARVLRALEAPALVAVPLVLAACAFLNLDQSALLTVATALLAVGVFFASFETSRPSLRQVMPTVVLAALAAAGRMLFAPIPDFKPVSAICILAGAVFGRRSGFMVGALAALVSNFFFGQGPWTPWQMFAFGIVGFLGGLIFRRKRGRWKHFRLWLCIYGGLSVLMIYGFLLDTASVFMGMGSINKAAFLAMYASGLPMNVIHGAATVFFLAVLGEPMLCKLERIRKKYGILEP